MKSSLRIAAIVAIAILAAPAIAQDATPAPGAARAVPAGPPATAAASRQTVPAGAPASLPPDSVTQQKLASSGLAFKATAGAIRLTSPTGEPQADIGFFAYQKDGADPRTRPVTFAFNGGPGSSSAFLHLGAIGPWRLPLEGLSPSSPPELVENAETWLEFTDLVFIDPPGTGYSRPLGGEDTRKRLYSVTGDVNILADFIQRWLVRNDRLMSPKYLAGESYGGFRAPRLAQVLATDRGVGITGIIMISPVIDFAGFMAPDASGFATRLPSYAAAAKEKRGEPVTRETLADAETYAGGDYILDFLKGPRDAAAVARMEQKVTALTSLDPGFVSRLQGRIPGLGFRREINREQGKVGAFYDTTIQSYDAYPATLRGDWLDPVADGFTAPLGEAIADLASRRLNWKTEQRYEVIDNSAFRAWDWGRGPTPPSSTDALRKMLALDPRFRVLVTHGFTDVQTPYFGTKLILDQIPDYGPPGRVRLEVFPGGHMHYTRDASRAALRDAVRGMMEEK